MSQRLLIGGPLLALWVAIVGALPATVSAQSSALEAAEAAYQEVDFEGARSHALTALRTGSNGPEQVVRIYQLLGISSSALGDEDAARDYFMRMLGVDPDASLDDSVPPRLRSPYMEARGAWAARPGRLGLEVGLDRANSAVSVQLRDPTDMARRVRVAARIEGEAEFEAQEYAAATAMNVPVVGAGEADRVEYYVDIMDMHGNTILSEGTAINPAVTGRSGSSGGEGGGGGGVTFFEEPVFWIIVGAVLAVGAGIAVGVLVDQRSRIGVQTGITIGLD